MGIGNTTAASALSAVFTGAAVDAVTGHGTGIDEDGRKRKIGVIETALARHRPDPSDPLGVLAAIGGLEIAVLVGVIAEAALGRIPIVLDGFISGSAALVAVALEPHIGPRLIAGHRSSERGHRVVLEHMGLDPILDLDLRLGEASGAALAIGVIAAAAAIRDEMATFDSAAVSGPAMPTGTAGEALTHAAAPGRIALVRHTPTSWSGHRYCGVSDPGLGALGRRLAARSAAELAPLLAADVRLVTSPRRRAIETMAALALASTAAKTPSRSTDAGRRPTSPAGRSRSWPCSSPTSQSASPPATPPSTGPAARPRPR